VNFDFRLCNQLKIYLKLLEIYVIPREFSLLFCQQLRCFMLKVDPCCRIFTAYFELIRGTKISHDIGVFYFTGKDESYLICYCKSI